MSGHRGPASVVVTSIAAPNAVLQEIASKSKARGLDFLVIGDLASPADFSLDGCEFYGLDRQRASGLKLAALLPTRHYARKNIGYLLAMRTRPRVILETDDDNLPWAEFWEERSEEQIAPSLSQAGWVNVYSYFTEANIWPRGLPLDAIHAPQVAYGALPVKAADCPIQQGLADGNPDVDAIYRLALPLPIRFLPGRRVALGPGAWSPFNSQNTAWFPKAYPLLYLPSFCSFRLTDIWRSFVAQRIAWENDWSVLYKSPDVSQERNEHDLMQDFADEAPGYLHNRAIGSCLEALKLAAGTENLGDNLIRCYEELVRLGLVGADEMVLVRAWVEDLTSVHGGLPVDGI